MLSKGGRVYVYPLEFPVIMSAVLTEFITDLETK